MQNLFCLLHSLALLCNMSTLLVIELWREVSESLLGLTYGISVICKLYTICTYVQDHFNSQCTVTVVK